MSNNHLILISRSASASNWCNYTLMELENNCDFLNDTFFVCARVCRYPYLAAVLNFSQTWALYCLVQFYSVMKEKLEPIKPLPKFLTFKSIVFLTWWQGVIVAFLFSTGYFKGHLAQELKTRIQDYIICIEVSSIAFYCSFMSETLNLEILFFK